MIVDLPSASTQDVSKKLVRLRNELGAVTLGRVLTLIVVVDEDDADEALEAANEATRQHPSRIIALVRGNLRGTNRLDAQIRVGGDAGASEIVVLRLYGPLADQGQAVVTPLLLPDSPVVAWWPSDAPDDVAGSPIGRMAQRRISDTAMSKSPRKALDKRARTYAPGDSDLAWTRITRWRGLLAAALDQAPFEPITEATVTGGADSPSTDLLAAWLAVRLRCPVRRARSRAGTGMVSVRLERASGPVDLVRVEGATATLTQPGQPDRRMTLARRTDSEALAEELRRLDPDEIYEQALVKGLRLLGSSTISASKAVSEGEAPSVDDARRADERVRRRSRVTPKAMVEREVPEPPKDSNTVKKAAARKLAEKQRSAGKATAAAEPAAGKRAAKKTATKKVAATRPAATKATAKKAAAKRPAATKAKASKATAKKAPARKTAKRASS